AASVAAAARFTRRRSRSDFAMPATSSSSDRKRRPLVRTSCSRFSLGLVTKRFRARSSARRSHAIVFSSHFTAIGSLAALSTGVFRPTFAKHSFRREVAALSPARRAVGHRCSRLLVLPIAARPQRRNDGRLLYETRWNVACQRSRLRAAARVR